MNFHMQRLILLSVAGDCSMALRLRTVTPESLPFEQARARWERVSAERRALRGRLNGARAALVVADFREGPGEFLAPVIADRARRYLDGRTPNRDRLVRELVVRRRQVVPSLWLGEPHRLC